ncbi:MAG: thioredoxin domain-containing protein [Acidobacteria bacterium]|nr:thioredoxin domain-containing protein [Acidobacteriota bacterium]
MPDQKHTNRLAGESSPYLLQHAHNPVDWQPWDDEALARSRDEDKPILLSIGYSACHWCHVMERESFENEAIARLMNEHFVSIKVDREERPDLDQIYMNAVQMMTGHGGWPLTVFLTPDLIPFYGGTYFPPEDRHNIPGFPRVLLGVAQAYRADPEGVTQTASSLLGELRRMSAACESNAALDVELIDNAVRALSRSYDPRHGGFGSAPKFPAAQSMELLLRAHARNGDENALRMVTETCRKMAEGGIYDQLGGGFHRYSTDARWLVPHFEKMLYDNAQLARLYLHVWQLTKDDFSRRVAEETFEYVAREMTDASGGFYSTQDADSEGVEGKFFVWSRAEIARLLGEDDAALLSAYYGVSDEGNFEGENILNVTRDAGTVARESGVTVGRLREAVERGRRVLCEARERRVKPARDEKMIAAWNGMMLASFAEAAAALERDDFRAVAERNADFILDSLRDGERLLHVFKDGRAKHHAFLDDYACVASALLTLYETTGTPRWLEASLALTETMIGEFWDAEDGGFFYTGASGERLIVRHKDFFDNATPSGNSVAADLLLRLSALTENEGYARKAVTVFRLTRDAAERYPSAFGCLLSALDFHLSTPKEIVIVGGASDDATRALRREVWSRFLPNKIVAESHSDDEGASKIVPLLRERNPIGGRPTAYVCENYACQQPVSDPRHLAAQLDAPAAKGARRQG